MSDLATLLSGAKEQSAADLQARVEAGQVAFTALVQHAITNKRTEVVHYVARDIGPALLAWIQASGGVASLVIGKDHAEIHVNLARQDRPVPAAQIISPDVATAGGDVPPIG